MNQKVALSSDALAQEVGGETVIMDLASDSYFGLDPVGTRIWQLLETDTTLAEVVATLAEEYDASREILEQDLLTLINELQEAGLARVVAP